MKLDDLMEKKGKELSNKDKRQYEKLEKKIAELEEERAHNALNVAKLDKNRDEERPAREKLKVKGREQDLLKVKEKQIAKYKEGVENYLANIRSARVGAAGVYGAAAAGMGSKYS